MKPHKHAELIKAWADGAEIEIFNNRPEINDWQDLECTPVWSTELQYRIKPEPKPDESYLYSVRSRLVLEVYNEKFHGIANLKLTFDGETGELKSAEVLK